MKARSHGGLFINGVFQNVLDEIVEVQATRPEQILYLQPATSRVMSHLQKFTPTQESPMILFISLTESLSVVSYTAEVVNWQNKQNLSASERSEVVQTLRNFQKIEKRLVGASSDRGANLLSVRLMRRLIEPFAVDRLIKSSDGQPLSRNRSRAGGWSYVALKKPEPLDMEG